MKVIVRITLLILIACSSLFGQINLIDSNLPIILIETNSQGIQDEPKITASMKIIDNGPGNRNQITDPALGYEGFIGIELRGASSQSFLKKGYGLETRNEDGSNRNVVLFGMPKENDWILHGPFSDKSLIRNALAYKLAGAVMPYAPRTQFCELIINGSYRGVYLFTEKIKIDQGRVDLEKLKIDENTGDDLTGGYIVKIDKTAGGVTEGWSSSYAPMLGASQRTYYQYHSPSPDKMSANQRLYIRNFITDFEDIMASENFADSLNGYREYIDPDSFIDFILLNEMCKNVDAYRLSTYLYKDKNSINPLMKAGPVWDFNLGFGNVDFCAGPSPQGWVMDYNSICPQDGYLIQFWWPKLLQDEYFGKEITNRWRELRNNEWSDSRIENCVNDLVGTLSESQVRNFSRWSILGTYVWPNAFIGNTYSEEVEQLKNWLTDRLNWMDQSIEELNQYQPSLPVRTETRIYPNPFLESLTFEFFGIKSEQLKIEVYNQLGQLVFFKEKDILITGKQSLEWTPTAGSSELYFYRIFLGGEEPTNGAVFRY